MVRVFGSAVAIAALAIGCSSTVDNTGSGGATAGSGGANAGAGGATAGSGGANAGAGGATAGSGGATAGAGGANAGAGGATAGAGGAAAGAGGATAGAGGATAGAGGANAGAGGTTDAGQGADSSHPDASADADSGGCVDLTVLNYLSWCSVTVAGHAASIGASQTVCVPPGAVSLSATALTGFKLGTAPWHRTDGDQGSGEQGTIVGQASTAKATVSGAKCVWVCCEFAAGGGCPTTNQCP